MIKALIEIGKALRERYPMPLVEVPYPHFLIFPEGMYFYWIPALTVNRIQKWSLR